MQKLFEVGPNEARSQPSILAWRPFTARPVFAISWRESREISFYDSLGKKLSHFELPKQRAVSALQWSPDGQILALVQKGVTAVGLWYMESSCLSWIDTSGNEVTFLRWCPVMPLLGAATIKGATLLYDARTYEQQTLSGVHTRAIRCGAWSHTALLALGSEDKFISITCLKGGGTRNLQTNLVPTQMMFSRSSNDSDPLALSVVLAAKVVLIYDISDTSRAIEVSLDKGLVKDIHWVNQEMLLIGYGSGHLAVLKVKLKEKRVDTVYCGRLCDRSMDALCYSAEANRLAVAGDGTLRLYSPERWSHPEVEAIDRLPEGQANCLQWSHDGNLLSLTTNTGATACISRRRVEISAVHGTKILYSHSLLELILFDVREESFPRYLIEVNFAVELGALGPSYCALVAENCVSYYNYAEPGEQEVTEDRRKLHSCLSLSFSEVIVDVAVGATKAAVLAGGRVHLHVLEDGKGSSITPQTLPNKDRKASATACALVGDYLLVAHSGHYVTCFSITYKTGIIEVSHSTSVTRLFPSHDCTLLAFSDAKQDLYVHNPYSNLCVKAGKADGSAQRCLWDVADPSTFVLQVGSELITYVHNQNHIHGERVEEVRSMTLDDSGTVVPCVSCHSELPVYSIPLSLSNGILHYKEPTGKVATLCLRTHSANVVEHRGLAMEKALPKFLQLVALNRLTDAFEVARDCLGTNVAANVKSPLAKTVWSALGKLALESTDLCTAERAFRQIPLPTTMWWLRDVKKLTEEKHILQGQILVRLEDYGKAEEAFLKSTQPQRALVLLQDLHQWEKAISLAETLNPCRLPRLHLNFAKSLERTEKFEDALRHYEDARDKSRGSSASAAGLSNTTVAREEGEGMENILKDQKASMDSQKISEVPLFGADKQQDSDVLVIQREALTGMARCAIRTGEIQRGMQIAIDLGDKDTLRQCAELLESRRQLPEAAALFEKGGSTEKAADLYIRGLQLDKAVNLLRATRSPKLHLLLAEANEKLGDFEAAVEHYKEAQNFPAAVKILLDKLNQTEAAFALVRQEKSSGAAEALAYYCMRRGQVKHAIEFLISAGKTEEALDLAETRHQMNTFVQHFGECTSHAVHQRIAKYYESQSLPGEAAQHYASCEAYEMALKLYIEGGQAWYDAALELVVRVNSQKFVRILEDHFKSTPQNLSYLSRLYESLGDHVEAAKISCHLAKEHQCEGQYKTARDILLNTLKNLRNRQVPIPDDVCDRLHILHCYILVKKLMNTGHLDATVQLLDKIAEHLNEFEVNAATILVSAVVTCQKIGKRSQAYYHACQLLLNPTYRQNIPEHHRRLIETVARKPPADGGLAVETNNTSSSPCPFCQSPLSDFVLRCSSCNKISPFCIATGKHVLSDDCASCPHCDLPARASFLQELLSVDPACPMCEKPLTADELQDGTSFLRKKEDATAEDMELAGRVNEGETQRAAADAENIEFIRATVRLVEEACII